jgi:hypothetical protein
MYNMKAAASILLVVFLSAQTPLGQILKLPLLIEHFYGHKQQSSVSLINFIIDHYSHEHHDADRSEDQQLPFKTVELCNIGSAIIPAAFQTDFSIQPNCLQKVAVNDVHRLQQHLCSIFHPPRTIG